MSLVDTDYSEKATFLPRRGIGEFTATVTVEETETNGLVVTMHPVQQGAEITDHAYNRAAEVRLRVLWNDDDAPLTETYQKLLDLQASREPFDVVTGKHGYKNMLMNQLQLTTDANTENILDITMELREVFIVSVETVSVPEKEKQAEPEKTQATQKTGKKQAKNTAPTSGDTNGSSSQRRSALSSLFGGGE